MFKNHGPGGCCCDCDCLISANFDSWVKTAGSWTITSGTYTYSAKTTDSSAELTCDKIRSGWKVFSVSATQVQLGEWIRFGFRDSSGNNRLYVRWKVTKPGAAYVHDMEIVELTGGTDTVLATINFTGSGLTQHFELLHDPDNDTVDIIHNRATAAIFVTRGTSSISVDRPYVATETITGQVTFGPAVFVASYSMLFRKCMYRQDGQEHQDRSPAEFEITIAGVKIGTGSEGGSFNFWNDTFVVSWFSASDVYYIGNAAFSEPYLGWSVQFTTRYDYGTKKLSAVLLLRMQTVNVIGLTAYGQAVIASKTWDGVCSYDWRTLGQAKPEQLPFVSSGCGVLVPDPCDWGADFSEATFEVVPVP